MRSLILCSALSLAAIAGSASARETILPGYWESQNSVSFPVNEQSVSHQCITPQKVEQFLSGPSSKHYKCVYDQSQVSDGAVSARGSCIDKNGLHSTIAVKGNYTPTTFDLNAELRINVGGLPIPVTAHTQAHRVSSDCPPDAPH
jgi:hypothetical protein